MCSTHVVKGSSILARQLLIKLIVGFPPTVSFILKLIGCQCRINACIIWIIFFQSKKYFNDSHVCRYISPKNKNLITIMLHKNERTKETFRWLFYPLYVSWVVYLWKHWLIDSLWSKLMWLLFLVSLLIGLLNFEALVLKHVTECDNSKGGHIYSND